MGVNYKSIPFHLFLTTLLWLSMAGHVFPDPLDHKRPLDERIDNKDEHYQHHRQETTGQTENDQWIILPGKVRPYRNADFEAELSDRSVAYPETIEGRIIHDDKTGDWIEFELDGEHVVLPRALAVRKTESGEDDSYSRIGSERLGRNTPLPLEYVPGGLIRLNQKWNFHGSDYSKYLRAEAAQAIEAMLEEARRNGIHIRVFSAYRSSEKQRYLYLKQIEKEGLRQNSVAKPGCSEHQLGTAVDLCGLDPESVASFDFDRAKEGQWIEKNALRFGFVRSYTRENQEETGITPEPWHYRYVGTVDRE